MSDDQMEKLIGTDSDDDEDFNPSAEPSRPVNEVPERPEINIAQMREAQHKNIFGSDDEGDDAGGDQRAAGDSQEARAAPKVEEDGYYERQATPDEVPKGPPMTVEVPLHDVLDASKLHIAKLSNILGLEPRPFDPETYQIPGDHEGYVDDRGNQRVQLRDLNAIRWRWTSDADGNLKMESNARLVKWSDGSIQLFVGSEAMDVRQVDVAAEQNYLYVRHPNLIQGQGQLKTKMVFRPASLESAAHKRLRDAVDARSTRQQAKVKATTTLVDPKKAQEERVKAEESRIKDKEKLAEKQQKQMRRYHTPTPNRRMGYGGGGINAAYLEDEDDELGDRDFDAEEEEERELRHADMNADDEEEAVRRLQAAKSGAPPSTKAGGVVQESEDEDISEEEDDEMKDFIVDEEEDDGAALVGSDDDDEEAKQQPATKKRGVVFDSDSE